MARATPEEVTVSVRDVPEVRELLELADQLTRAARAVVHAWSDQRGFELGERIEELRLLVEKAEGRS